jgi:hypothetical protein
MTIGEYRAKLQNELREAALGKNYDVCLDLAFLLELLEGAADDIPAHFLTFSEIVQIAYASAELAGELVKEQRIPDGDHFRVTTRFYALAEARKLRGETQSLAAIADAVRAAFPARQASSGATTSGSLMTIGEYRTHITEDLKRVTAEKDRRFAGHSHLIRWQERWHVEHLSSILDILQDVKDGNTAHFLTFSDIVRIGVAAREQAEKFNVKEGRITSGERLRVILYFFALAEGFTLRGQPMSLDGIADAVRIRLEKQDKLQKEILFGESSARNAKASNN